MIRRSAGDWRGRARIVAGVFAMLLGWAACTEDETGGTLLNPSATDHVLLSEDCQLGPEACQKILESIYLAAGSSDSRCQVLAGRAHQRYYAVDGPGFRPMPFSWKMPQRVGVVVFMEGTTDLHPAYEGQTFIDWDEIKRIGMHNSPTDLMGAIGHEEVHQTGEHSSEPGWNDWNSNPANCVSYPH